MNVNFSFRIHIPKEKYILNHIEFTAVDKRNFTVSFVNFSIRYIFIIYENILYTQKSQFLNKKSIPIKP